MGSPGCPGSWSLPHCAGNMQAARSSRHALLLKCDQAQNLETGLNFSLGRILDCKGDERLVKKHRKAPAHEALTSYIQRRLLLSAYLPGQPGSITSYDSLPANAPCPALLSKTYFVESFQCWGTKTTKGEPSTTEGGHAAAANHGEAAKAQSKGAPSLRSASLRSHYGHAGHPWEPSA